MEAKTRIYEVAGGTPQRVFLIEATSRSAAFDVVAAKFVGAVVLPSGKRIAELMTSGIKVETNNDQ